MDSTSTIAGGASFHGEPTMVTIKASDGSFMTSGCATWTRVK
jgi:hypothetical protein